MKFAFADRMTYDANQKTAVSIRDGVLEYLGAELGKEPADKVFTVYRSPATIANAAAVMKGIPVTDEHVSLDESPPIEGGSVESSEMIDAIDPITKTTIATRNKLSMSDALRALTESGKRELSLGYHAELVEHADYDFEQKNIMPHHLAIVSDGRCGSMCSFLDRKTQTPKEETTMLKLHKAFLDEAGAMNLQQVAEVVASFPEAIKQMDLDQVKTLVPMLQEAIASVKTAGAEMPAEDEEMEGEEVETMDAEKEEDKEEEKPNFADSTAFKDAVKAEAIKLTDVAIKEHNKVIEKAKSFVGEEYSFTDKSTKQVMVDALATQSTETFTDEELPTAFKLLKSTGNYKDFGDKKQGGLTARIESELGE